LRRACSTRPPPGRPRAPRPPACAARELAEETGLIADGLELIAYSAGAPGFTNEATRIFRATGLRRGSSHPDEGEFVDVVWLPVPDVVEAIAEQGLEPVLSEMQAMHEAGALVIGWRTAHTERKGRQYLKKHQTMVGNPHCHYALQKLGLPDEERESLLALLELATTSSVDLAYDVAEDLEDADDAIRDFIDAANFLGMNCVLRVRPDLAEGTPHGRFAAALCAYLTGHPEEGKRYLDLIGTIATPADRQSIRRSAHTLARSAG